MAGAGPDHDIIVAGASAGGVEVLMQLCSHLPANLKASVFIVLHTAPKAPGLLPTILQRFTDLDVLYPLNGQTIELEKIYIAPPNRHMLLQNGKIELSIGPRENLLRPSVDALFRTAARVYGPRVVGVILSGTRSDGTLGLQLIKQAGGVAIVQDPQEAMFSSMPDSALQNLGVDYVLKIAEIAEQLVILSGTSETAQGANQGTHRVSSMRKTISDLFKQTISTPQKESGKTFGSVKLDETTQSGNPRNMESKEDQGIPDEDPVDGAGTSDQENSKERMIPDQLVRKNEQQYEKGDNLDGNTPLTCPECGGTLWEVFEGKLSLYVCHVGHRFSESSLISGIDEKLEESLWVAVRALEERSFFYRRLAYRSETSGRKLAAQKFEKQAEEAIEKGRLIRDILISGRITDYFDTPEEGIS